MIVKLKRFNIAQCAVSLHVCVFTLVKIIFNCQSLLLQQYIIGKCFQTILTLFEMFMVKIFTQYCLMENLIRDFQLYKEMGTQTQKVRAAFLTFLNKRSRLIRTEARRSATTEEHGFEHPPFKRPLLHHTIATKQEISLPAVAPLAVDSCLRVLIKNQISTTCFVSASVSAQLSQIYASSSRCSKDRNVYISWTRTQLLQLRAGFH